MHAEQLGQSLARAMCPALRASSLQDLSDGEGFDKSSRALVGLKAVLQEKRQHGR